MTISIPLILGLASFAGGFIDAVVGGGGLIVLPSLFLALPAAPVPFFLGTNKVAAILGTSVSAWRYQKRLQINLRSYRAAFGSALIGAFIGAKLAVYLNPAIARPMIAVLLAGVWIFMLVRPDFGSAAARPLPERDLVFRSTAMALAIGFYDGFFGPGTGTWFVAAGIVFLGLDFLGASGVAKPLNIATNFAALVAFTLAGTVYWTLGLYLGGLNILGSLIGTSLALRKGSGFVRVAFLVVVGALILRLAAQSLGWAR